MHYSKKIIYSVAGIFLFANATAESLFDAAALNPDNIVYLSQNWTEEDREFFYFTDQGSRLIPYDIFLNLEQVLFNEID